jgi:hypothetical protein
VFIWIKGRCSFYCFLHRLGMDWCLDSRGYGIIEANSPRKGKYECNQVLKISSIHSLSHLRLVEGFRLSMSITDSDLCEHVPIGSVPMGES